MLPLGEIDLDLILANTVDALVGDALPPSCLELYECCRLIEGGVMVDGVSGERLRTTEAAMLQARPDFDESIDVTLMLKERETEVRMTRRELPTFIARKTPYLGRTLYIPFHLPTHVFVPSCKPAGRHSGRPIIA